jgi:hypothetical protein
MIQNKLLEPTLVMMAMREECIIKINRTKKTLN